MNNRIFTIPTLITAIRIICTPFLAFAIAAQSWGQAITLFVISALSDALDGYCARWLDARSHFGAALDPIADKFLMLAIYSGLLAAGIVLPQWFVVGVLIKEAILIFCAAGALALWGGVVIAPHALGKWAMTLQVMLVGIILGVRYSGGSLPLWFDGVIAGVFLIICAALVQYLYGGVWAFLKKTSV